MLHIAVCDDQKEVIEEICTILSDYSKMRAIEIKTYKYHDGITLLSNPSSFDIIFLDIEMKYSNGIEVAQEIRKCNINVPIVYITSYTDYWRRAFKVHAFEFISKPFNSKDVYSCMDDYIEMMEASEEESILFQTNNGIERIELNDIIYLVFESKKKVLLQTRKERIIVKENLSDIYERLDKTHFYQTRRDSIVNLKHVQKLQNEYVIIMKDGTMIPLAQKKKEDFMTRLTTEFVDNMKGRKNE